MKIKLILLGLRRDGYYSYHLKSKNLRELLEDSLPKRKIYVSNENRELNVEYKMQYSVVHAKDEVKELEKNIANNLESKSMIFGEAARKKSVQYVLPCNKSNGIKKYFDELYQRFNSKKNILEYTVFLCNPNKMRIFFEKFGSNLRNEEEAEEKYSYAYKYDQNGTENQIWMSDNRYFFFKKHVFKTI